MRIISSNSLNRRRASLSAVAVASFPLVRGVSRTVRLISSTALSLAHVSLSDRVARSARRINERAEASVMNDAKSRGIVVVGVVVGAADCGEARRQGVRVSCECPTFAESPTVRDKLVYVISDTRYPF